MKILYFLIYLFTYLECFWSNPSCLDLQNDFCSCFPEIDLEIQCPGNWTRDDEGLVIHINEEILKIDCYDMKYFTTDLLPELNLNNISRLEIYNCPAPNNFQQIAKHFSIKKLKVLQFEHSNTSVSLTDGFFQSFDLERLKLNLLNFHKIEENIFSNLSNLISLEMERNKNMSLPPKLLQNLSNLKALLLSQNNLSTIPQGFFNSLNNLRYLFLWSNRLKIINPSTFQNLQSLITLELSRNQIEFIAEDAFKNLKQLSKINLSENKLKTISSELFKYNSQLTLVLIERNPALKLTDFLFSNLEKLEKVALTSIITLNHLPGNLYENSTQISSLNLQDNNLEELDENVFRGLIKLKELHLENNKIYELEGNIFKDLISLEEIYLQNNLISKLKYDTFYNKPKLKIINLANNNISADNCSLNILATAPNVKSINLSNNFIRKIENIIEANSMFNLEKLDLKNNLIKNLKLVNFQSHSNLFVDLDCNKINRIFVQDFETIKTLGKVTFSIKNNLMKCDCNSVELYDFLKEAKFKNYDILNETLLCQNPEQFKDIRLIDLQPDDFKCQLENKFDECPSSCSCSWRPYDASFVVNCTNLNFTEFPNLKNTSKTSFNYNQIEIHLQNNNLNKINRNLKGYENVSKLFLSKNVINIVEWLPPKLQVLDLNNNNLSHFNFEILKTLNNLNLTSLKIDENPWKCDCASNEFSVFLQKHTRLVDVERIICDNKQLLVNLSKSDLCEDYLLFYIIIPVIIVVLVFIFTLILFFIYEQEIKIWLFSKNLCLWWVTEEELDKDKTYDAFISYSHKDEEFVIKNLLPILESGPNPYKLCLHFRDFIPGEFITTQITNSVLDSRRTLVVLSKNFLESIWGKMEFRTAHTLAMTEGRARVIIVLYGDIQVDELDEELKSYLKTNTYVKWGDSYFWNKLQYALPHTRMKISKDTQKITNVINYIGNKFSSVENNKHNLDTIIVENDQIKKNVQWNFHQKL